jgi:hypothetical protein
MPTQQTNAASGQMIGSGVTALASGFATLQAASMQARQFKIENIFLGLQANAEKLKARENANFLRKQFMQNLGSANVSLSHRGISTGSGIGRRTTIEGLRNLGEDLQANELNSQGAQLQLKLNQSQTRLAEKTVRATGMFRSSEQFAGGSKSLLTGFSTIKTGGENGN